MSQIRLRSRDVDEAVVFEPPRRRGAVFHLFAIVVLAALAAWSFSSATRTPLGPLFLFYLLVATLLALPLPLLVYRLDALRRSRYRMERNGLRLRWGLRAEDIPMDRVLWVRSAAELEAPLELPRPRWPGAVLGVRHHAGLGAVEFMASEEEDLVLIGTAQRVFAISPGDAKGFLRAFQTQTELGSLSPIRAFSAYPTFLLAELWAARPARWLLLGGLTLSLAMFVWVGIAIPNLETIRFGPPLGGAPPDPVSPAQLFLLPVINLVFFLANFVLAIYFQRRDGRRPLSYVLWGSSLLTALLFMGGVYIILRTG